MEGLPFVDVLARLVTNWILDRLTAVWISRNLKLCLHHLDVPVNFLARLFLFSIAAKYIHQIAVVGIIGQVIKGVFIHLQIVFFLEFRFKLL